MLRGTCKLFLCLAIFATGCAAVNESERAHRSPEQLVSDYYVAYASFDWAKMANTLDPTELEEFADLYRKVTKPLGIVSEGASDRVAFGEAYEWYLNQRPPAKEYVANLKAKILGVVSEGDDLRNVIVRVNTSVAGYDYTDVEVATAKPDHEAQRRQDERHGGCEHPPARIPR